MVGSFVEECRRRDLNVKSKSKVMVLNGEEGLECEVCIDVYAIGACVRV